MIGKQKIQRRRKSRKTYFVGATIAALSLGIIVSLVTYPSREEIQTRQINSKLEQLFNYDLDNNGISRPEYRKYLEEN